MTITVIKLLNFVDPNLVTILSVVLIGIIVLAFVTCGSAWYIFKNKFGSDRPRGMLYASVNPEYMSAGYGKF